MGEYALQNEKNKGGNYSAVASKSTTVVQKKEETTQTNSDLDKISQADRSNIQISLDSISQGNTLAELFDKSQNWEIDGDIKNQTTFSSTIEEDMKTGLLLYLQSMYNILSGGTSITRRLRFSADKPKDLQGYSDNSKKKMAADMAYRFTVYTGTADKKPHALIEELGEYKEKPADTVENYKTQFANYNFSFQSTNKSVVEKGVKKNIQLTFSDNEKRKVYKMLALMPTETLSKLKGVKFYKDRHNPSDGNLTEMGHYDPNDHTITLYEEVFASNDTVVGDAEGGFFNQGDHTIIHELAHAIDASKHAQLWAKLQEAEGAVDKALDAYNKQVDIYNANKTKAELDKLTTLELALNKAKQDVSLATSKYASAVSASGKGKEKDAGGVYRDSKSYYKTDFTTAVNTDKYAVSKYGETSFSESFAESFGLHVLDKKRFKSLRPNQSKYFDDKKYL